MDKTFITPLLRQYLLQHEDDIAQEINEYGDLRDIFKSVCGRTPADNLNTGPDK